MPRGVPANGFRRTRAVLAAEAGADPESALAGSAVDGADADVADPAEEEDPAEAASADEVIPADPPELTPQQRRIKDLENQLALASGRKDEEPEVEPVEPGDGNIHIHFLEDGLTVNGKVMYRGDELEFSPTSGAYRDTFDRNGKTWLDLRTNEFAQVDRWGKIMFRNGPWPGKSYADGKFEQMRQPGSDALVPVPSEDEIARAEKARKQRAAPRLPQRI